MTLKFGPIIKDERGVAGVEFALSVPVLLGLFIGAVELSGYMEIARRAEMSNNSMAQVLSAAGGGAEAAMHFAWHIPSQINPNANYEWDWKWKDDTTESGRDWRNPFAFSQIVFKQACPTCASTPQRDFMFAMGFQRECGVEVIGKKKRPSEITQLPKLISERGKPVMMIAHTAQYKPLVTARFLPLNDYGAIDITRISYAVRHDGKLYSYPNSAHGMYRMCGGPT